VADIFVSYTSSDRDWAFWIGQELERLGHVAHIHEWEIDAGGNIPAWMQDRQDKADHTLCVFSNAYLTRPYSSWERQAAEWAAATERPNFLLPVFVEDCKAPILLAPFKRCNLFGLNEDEARERLEAYLKPAARPSNAARFPGEEEKTLVKHQETIAFPGNQRKLSNTSSSSRPLPRTFSPPHLALSSQSILIGVLILCALGLIVWILSSLHSGPIVKAGDCGFANSGSATGNTVNCGPPPVSAPKP
jgi:hypothetical protein